MPELPEVETIARALALRLEGRRIERLAQSRPDLRFPLPRDLPRRVGGRRLDRVRRRGKFLLLDLDSSLTLILHLGMSGRLVYDGPPARHEHLTFDFDDGTVLRFVDPRRFGMADLWPTAGLESHPMLARLGLEPLSPAFTTRRLQALLAGRRAPLKTALLDQRLIAGLGNIYVSEALFAARLSPERAAGSLGADEAARLVRAIRSVLRKATTAGGSSLRDYVQADGELGSFQSSFAVYGRLGLACPRCRGPIRRSVQSGRSTFFCPRCQGPPAAATPRA
jgi:formamidopyrimidine-DNA glycosylase